MIGFLKKLQPREKKMLLVLGTLIIVYLAYTTLFENTLAKFNQVKDELELSKQREDDLNMELFNYNTLKNRYESYDMDELLVTLPAQGKFHEIILWIEELFSETSLSNPSVNFSLIANEESYLQITFAFSGPYNSIYGLMQNIENNPRLTIIDSVNLTGSQEDLAANIVVRVYGQSFQEIPEGDFDFSNTRLFRGE